MDALVTVIAGYLIGSIPVALLVSNKIDPRTWGDRNLGWWNTRSVVGERRAALVLIGDTLKGVLAVLLAYLLWHGPWWAAYVAAGAAMIGHSFPLFARFKGGKSILTFVGAVLVIAPVATLLAIAIGAAVGAARHSFSIGGRIAMFAFPFTQALFQPLTHVAASGALMTFIGLRFLTASSRDPSTGARAEASPQ